MPGNSIVRAAVVTVGVMMIPLWGNLLVDDWNWSWQAFVTWGALVFIAAVTYQVAVKDTSNKAYRFASGIALIVLKTPVAVPVVGVNGLSVVLFAISALLFRRAARSHQVSTTQ